jgi:hypothetical protein
MDMWLSWLFKIAGSRTARQPHVIYQFLYLPHPSPILNPRFMRFLVALLLATQAWAQAQPAAPLSVSGIYPQLTVFNSDPKRERPEMECGLGAVVPWAGKLWSTTFSAPRDNTARASCGNEAKRNFLSVLQMQNWSYCAREKRRTRWRRSRSMTSQSALPVLRRLVSPLELLLPLLPYRRLRG